MFGFTILVEGLHGWLEMLSRVSALGAVVRVFLGGQDLMLPAECMLPPERQTQAPGDATWLR